MDLKAVGKRIKAAREQKGLTQEALAELVNLSPMHVSVIERGFKPTKMDTFCNIANALDASADTRSGAKYTTASKRILKPTMKTADFASKQSKRLPAGFLLL